MVGEMDSLIEAFGYIIDFTLVSSGATLKHLGQSQKASLKNFRNVFLQNIKNLSVGKSRFASGY